MLDDTDRGVERSAASHDEHGLEDLERSDEGDDRDQEEGWRQHRQRHIDESSPRARAVDLRGVIEMCRDSLQTRQNDDEGKADRLPQVDHDDRRHRPRRRQQPALGGNAQQIQVVVDEAEVGIEDEVPDQRDRRPGHDDRKEYRGAKQVAQDDGNIALNRQRQCERESHVEHERPKSEDKRVDNGLAPTRVLEQRPVVLQPNELGVRKQIPLEEAESDRADQWPRDEDQKEDDRRAQQQVRDQRLPPPEGGGALAAFTNYPRRGL